jgi:hypothetical protein
MKLNMSLVRELLFFLEKKQDVRSIQYTEIEIPGYVTSEIGVHLSRMYEAGFISGEVIRSSSTNECIIEVIPFDLTWEGHQFLNAIRSDTVWNAVMEKMATVGSFSLSILKELAIEYAKTELGLSNAA